jgi:hypothetical protein
MPFWSSVAVPVSSAPAPVSSASPAMMSFRIVTPNVPDAAVSPARRARRDQLRASGELRAEVGAGEAEECVLDAGLGEESRALPADWFAEMQRLHATHRRETDRERGHHDTCSPRHAAPVGHRKGSFTRVDVLITPSPFQSNCSVMAVALWLTIG